MRRLYCWLFRRVLKPLFARPFAKRFDQFAPLVRLKCVTLDASPLETREPTGNLVNGLFAAALGGTMTEPIEAIAAFVGDFALLDGPDTVATSETPLPLTPGRGVAETGTSEPFWPHEQATSDHMPSEGTAPESSDDGSSALAVSTIGTTGFQAHSLLAWWCRDLDRMNRQG